MAWIIILNLIQLTFTKKQLLCPKVLGYFYKPFYPTLRWLHLISVVQLTLINYATLLAQKAFLYIMQCQAHSCFSTAVLLSEMYPFCPVQLKLLDKPFVQKCAKKAVSQMSLGVTQVSRQLILPLPCHTFDLTHCHKIRSYNV